MVGRLLDAGIAPVICDPNAEAIARLRDYGATVAGTPRELAAMAEIVFASLPGLKISQDVALGPQGIVHGKAVRVYIEMSTLGSATVQGIAEGLRSAGIDFLDCPVASGPTGGPRGIIEGKMSVMPCGPRAAFERARPFMELLAGKVFYLGEKPGSGQIAKLINNHLSKAGKVAAFEGIVMGLKAGLDPVALIELINISSGRNGTTLDKIPAAIFSGAFKLNGPLSSGLKDAELFVSEAKRLGVAEWMGSAVLAAYSAAADQGYRDRDSMELVRYFEELSDVEPERRVENLVRAKDE